MIDMEAARSAAMAASVACGEGELLCLTGESCSRPARTCSARMPTLASAELSTTLDRVYSCSPQDMTSVRSRSNPPCGQNRSAAPVAAVIAALLVQTRESAVVRGNNVVRLMPNCYVLARKASAVVDG